MVNYANNLYNVNNMCNLSNNIFVRDKLIENYAKCYRSELRKMRMANTVYILFYFLLWKIIIIIIIISRETRLGSRTIHRESEHRTSLRLFAIVILVRKICTDSFHGSVATDTGLPEKNCTFQDSLEITVPWFTVVTGLDFALSRISQGYRTDRVRVDSIPDVPETTKSNPRRKTGNKIPACPFSRGRFTPIGFSLRLS